MEKKMTNQRKDYTAVACAILGFFATLSGAKAATVQVVFDWSVGFGANESTGTALPTTGTSLQLGWFASIPTNWGTVNRANLAGSFTTLAELSYIGSGNYTFEGEYAALDPNLGGDPGALNKAFLVITSGTSQLGIFSWAKTNGSAFFLPRDPDVYVSETAVDTTVGSTSPFMYNMNALVGSVSSSGVQLASASGAVTSPQSITFGAIPSKSVGDSFTLAATATSGLPVSYSSSNPSVATVAGNVVTIVGAGSVEIIASQSGNSSYAPATDARQSVTAYASTTLRVASLGTPVLNGGQTSVTHTFVGNPNATYTIEYKNDLSAATWTTITAQTGVNGTFTATFTSSGDYVNAWKNRMFFRAKNS
jgi:hypothetical protein